MQMRLLFQYIIKEDAKYGYYYGIAFTVDSLEN